MARIKVLSVLAAAAALLAPVGAWAEDFSNFQFPYRFNKLDPTATNVTPFGGADSAGVEQAGEKKIDFTFNWQGEDEKSAYVSENGAISFAVTDGHCGQGQFGTNCMQGPGAIPTQGGNKAKDFIAPWWSSLRMDPNALGGPSTILVMSSAGDSPNRVGVYEWNNMYFPATPSNPAVNNSYNFQVRLYETANVAIVSYGPKSVGTDKGVSASAGSMDTNNAGGYLLPCKNLCGDSDFPEAQGVIIPVPTKAELIPYVAVSGVSVTADTIMFDVTPTLSNAGGTDTANASYDLLLSSDAVFDAKDTIIASKPSFSLASKTTFTGGTIHVALPRPADGEYLVGMVADGAGLVAEATKGTNVDRANGTIVVGKDVYGTVSGPASAGTDLPVTLTVTLSNRGSDATGKFKYEVYLGLGRGKVNPNDTLFYSGTAQLNAGETSTFQVTTKMARQALGGNAFYKLLVNGDSAINDINPSNDSYFNPTQMNVSAPNLKVTSFTLVGGGNELYMGLPVHAQATIANAGLGVADYFTYSLRASKDSGGVTFNSPQLIQMPLYCGQQQDCVGAWAEATCEPNAANIGPDLNSPPQDCELPCNSDADCPAGSGLKCDTDFGGWCSNIMMPGDVRVVDLVGILPSRDDNGAWPTDKPFPCFLGVSADDYQSVPNETTDTGNGDNIFPADTKKPFSCRLPAADGQVINAPDAVPPITDFIAPDKAAAGEGTEVFRDIHNIGNVDVELPYSYYLSANNIISVNDMVIPFSDGRLIHTSHLLAGSDDQGYDNLVIPANVNPSSSFYIGIILDPANKIAELKEDNNIATSPKQLLVTSGPLTVDQSPPPTAVVGVPYVHQLIAFGGGAGYHWSVIPNLSNRCTQERVPGCELPSGLTLRDDGILQGTATTDALKINNGLYDFGVQVTSGTSTYQAVFTMRVVEATGPLTILTGLHDPNDPTIPVLPTAYLGKHYRAAIVASGGVPPYSWEVSVSGGGITPDDAPNQNILEGTPDSVGTITVTAKVTDSRKASVLRVLKINTVLGDVVHIVTTTLPNATTGDAYIGYLDATGGVANSRQWIAQNLPPGLSMEGDADRGKITGIPTEIGTWVVPVSVVDMDGNRAESVVGLQVTASSYFKTKVLADAIPGGTYKDAVKAKGGTAPVTYTLVAGTLPEGISLASTGDLTGTVDKAAAAGTSNFAIEARDATNHVGRAAFGIVVVYPDATSKETGAAKNSGGCSTAGGLPGWAGVLAGLALIAWRRRS